MKKGTIKDKIEGNELDLSLNGLTEVPVQELASAPKATHLDLSCNEIRLLPNNFASLTHLVKIDLSKNFLTELPHNFGSLTNLVYLDLYGNRLATLPLSFCRLKNLKWLDLKNNPLNPGLKQIAGDCLDQGQCQKCAKDIVAFMQSMESEMERQKQKRLKEEREKEAARIAKEQEELAEQRRLKKAERERRKAEAKARRLANQQNQNEKLQSSEHGNASGMSKESQNISMSKSGSCWRTCCFTAIMVPILFVVCVVGMRLLQGHSFESLSSFVEETHLELKEALEVWWNAFALPHLLSMKMSLQNWFHSVS